MVNRNHNHEKRQREAERDRKKKEKEARLRHNREMRARGLDPDVLDQADSPQSLPEVSLEQIITSGVAPRPPRSERGPTKLFVGGLSWDTTNEGLTEAFAKFGPLVEATIITDRMTGSPRGFGFVTFETASAAAEAIKQMDGAELHGRMLKVNPADRG